MQLYFLLPTLSVVIKEEFRAPKKEKKMFSEKAGYAKNYTKNEKYEEPICRHCGKPKDEVLSEENFSYHYVCLRCETSTNANLSIRKIKGIPLY